MPVNNLTEKTHRLSEMKANHSFLDPLHCQRCGSMAHVSSWQEHDHHDQPELKIVVLCRTCSDLLIEPHPRLYRVLFQNEPWPGTMEICLDCKFREVVRCGHPRAKANGGIGVKLTFEQPTLGFVDGCTNGKRWGKTMKFYAKPVSACEQKEVPALKREKMTIAEAADKLPACPKRCNICPGRGHHWMIAYTDPEGEQENDPNWESTLYLQCKHCEAVLYGVDVFDPDMPEI